MLGFQGGVSIPLVKGGVKAPPAKRQCRAAPKAWLDAAWKRNGSVCSQERLLTWHGLGGLRIGLTSWKRAKKRGESTIGMHSNLFVTLPQTISQVRRRFLKSVDPSLIFRYNPPSNRDAVKAASVGST